MKIEHEGFWAILEKGGDHVHLGIPKQDGGEYALGFLLEDVEALHYLLGKVLAKV